MALGFFRKRKKLVFWIMVVLMVVFLLSIGGAQPVFDLFAPRGADFALGRAGSLKVTERTLQRADDDLSALQLYLGLGDPFREVSGFPRPVPGEKGFLLTLQEPNPNFCWLLLAHEARNMGFSGGEVAQDDFLAAYLNLPSERFEALLAALSQRGVLEKDVRRALDDYLVIMQASRAALAGVGQTDPALRRLFAEVRNRLDVGIVELAAENFDKSVGEPDPNELKELFNEGRESFRGDARGNPNPFRFGYRQPPRVSLEYVFIDYDDVVRTVTPDEPNMLAYWQEHQGEITKQVPLSDEAAGPDVEGATQSATEAATQPASTQPKTTTVVIDDYTEAKPQIRRILRESQTRQKLSELAEDTLRLAREYQSSPPEDAPGDVTPLELAARQMLKSGHKVRYKRTELLDQRALQADEILGRAHRGPAARLAELAFTVKELASADAQRLSTVEVGKLNTQSLDVTPPEGEQGKRGKLVWAVAQAQPAEVPASLEEVREQVEADWKKRAAFELARARASELAAAAREHGLAEAAEAADMRLVRLQDVNRRAIAPGGLGDEDILDARNTAAELLEWLREGQQGEQPKLLERGAYLKAALAPRFELIPSPMIPIDPEDPEHGVLLDAIFSLAPEEGSGELPSQKIATAELPAGGSVFVLERLEYTPAYEQEYRDLRLRVGGLLIPLDEIQRHELAVRWFDQDQIVERTGYQEAEQD